MLQLPKFVLFTKCKACDDKIFWLNVLGFLILQNCGFLLDIDASLLKFSFLKLEDSFSIAST